MKQATSYTLTAKRLALAIVHGLLLMGLTGCDNWRETAGDLAGMWQLAQWRDNATHEVIRTQSDQIYYCVQRQLIKFQDGRHSAHYYLSYYTRTRDAIVLSTIIEYPADTIVTDLTTLTEQFAVPADKCFNVELLDDHRLLLTTERATLSFRKY
mgnify:CR=1 FL=1